MISSYRQLAIACLALSATCTSIAEPLYNDSHFHLTNYIQEGTDIKDYLEIMGDKVPRSTLFGIPLQQTWNHHNTGDYAPGYYLQSDAPLYYYSFTDAHIALQYQSLKKKQQQRLEPMITGFNPTDMYAADHIRRVLTSFPGVFTGIGEFTIHKEFVSAKIAGNTASLTNPALDKILSFAGEVGLVVLLHSDIDIPFAKKDDEPVYLQQMKSLLKRHPETSIIWAHIGLGRVVHPVVNDESKSKHRNPDQLELIQAMLDDKAFDHVYFDISWDEVAKYSVASPKAVEATAEFLNKNADRILFGTDYVAPTDQKSYLSVYEMWQPVWDKLDKAASQKIRFSNFDKVYSGAAKKVRAWEKTNL